MINVNCLNNIAACGLKLFSDEYNTESSFEDAQAVLVRSAKMHDMELSDNLLAIARAGAGVNNIPLDKCAEEGIVVFNTPGANANAVKEQVIAAMLLASRDLIGGNKWVADNAEDPDIAKATEKAKKAFAGQEIKGKKLGVIGLGAIGQLVANAAIALGMEVYGYDPYVSVKAAWNLSSEVKYISDVKDIYKECNYITVHVPALDSTKGMINKEAFDLSRMYRCRILQHRQHHNRECRCRIWECLMVMECRCKVCLCKVCLCRVCQWQGMHQHRMLMYLQQHFSHFQQMSIL